MGLGETLKHECKLELTDLDKEGSQFFKLVFQNSARGLRKK
jgi:hypothetical protein